MTVKQELFSFSFYQRRNETQKKKEKGDGAERRDERMERRKNLLIVM